MAKTITSGEITALLKKSGVNADVEYIGNDSYALPTADWINGDFAKAFFTWVNHLGLVWEQGAEDCKEFSRQASSYAQFLNAQTKDHPPGVGLAVGEYHYYRDDGQAHAINIVVTEDDAGKLALLFWEPQTQSAVTLTTSERWLCEFVRF